MIVKFTSRFACLAAIAVFWLTGPADAQTGVPCVPVASSEPLSAGLSRLVVDASCRPGQKIKLKYDSVELVRFLDAKGHVDIPFDCFLGDKPGLTITYQDNTTSEVRLHTVDLDRVTKIALIWKGAVNLDLHAFEYAAGAAEDGHIWAGSPSSRWTVEDRLRQDKRGHGFLSFASDGTAEGDQLEVYTFVHAAGQTAGAVTLALDYESRTRTPQDPDTCGTGLYADLEYKVMLWRSDGHLSRSRGSFAALDCSPNSSAYARYSYKAMPQLILTR